MSRLICICSTPLSPSSTDVIIHKSSKLQRVFPGELGNASTEILQPTEIDRLDTIFPFSPSAVSHYIHFALNFATYIHFTLSYNITCIKGRWRRLVALKGAPVTKGKAQKMPHIPVFSFLNRDIA